MNNKTLSGIDVAYCRRLLEEMVAIPSVVNEEREMAEYLKWELEALGLETRFQPVEGTGSTSSLCTGSRSRGRC